MMSAAASPGVLGTIGAIGTAGASGAIAIATNAQYTNTVSLGALLLAACTAIATAIVGLSTWRWAKYKAWQKLAEDNDAKWDSEAKLRSAETATYVAERLVWATDRAHMEAELTRLKGLTDLAPTAQAMRQMAEAVRRSHDEQHDWHAAQLAAFKEMTTAINGRDPATRTRTSDATG